jgi:hypothetical protein
MGPQVGPIDVLEPRPVARLGRAILAGLNYVTGRLCAAMFVAATACVWILRMARMATDQQRLSEADRANLVAYLDGELTERDEQLMSTKLTQSVSGRRELESLKKTWELLDLLPRPSAPDDFTSRTLTEVEKIGVRGAELASAASSVARRVMVIAATATALLVSVAVGYCAVRWLWPDPTARLARDLSLAEHLDEYRDAGSFEFLELLDQSTAFNESAP